MERSVRFADFGITHRKGEFSSFRSRVRIPVPVETERMKIHFKRGILEVHLPRKKGYRIKIE
jgi:HSP20 family molecular chaperone IbpA